MGLWDGLRSRLFGDGPDPAGPTDPAEPVDAAEPADPANPAPDEQVADIAPTDPGSEADLTPPAPLALEDSGASPFEPSDIAETGDTESPLPPLRAEDQGEGAEDAAEAPEWESRVPARQERAAGRILDDEGLRSDLTDDEYQPLLDWALSVTDAVAAQTAHLDDEQAEAQIDAGLGVLREVIRAASDAIVAHNEVRADDRRWALDAISQTWKPTIIGDDESDLQGTLWRPLQQLADRLDAEPDLFGPEVAAAIVAALAAPSEAGSTESPSASSDASAGPAEPHGDAASEPTGEHP